MPVHLDKGVFTEHRDPVNSNRVRTAFGGMMRLNEQNFSPETIEYD